MTMQRIHPTAIVSNKAQIGVDVVIGPYAIVYDNVRIGDGCSVGAYCEIGLETPLSDGVPLIIADGAVIRSYTVLYEGSTFGPGLVTGHRVSIREKTRAGENLQIGTLSDVQGDCEIGDYVRFHSNVHIGKHSKIGSFVWIFPYVVLTNDPHPPSMTMRGVVIADYAAIATMSVVLPGVRVGEDSLIAAHSSVARDVEPLTVVGGNPAKFICHSSKIKLKDQPKGSAYPWRRHFHRGYPADIVDNWKKEFEIR